MGTERRHFSGFWLVGLLALVLVAAGLPPGGTFRDDDGNRHEAFIEAIAAEGITTGCNPPANDEYCPRRTVTRGQMAAFLVRALGLTEVGAVDFVDDDDSVFETDIEKLAEAGITFGCNPPDNDRFCPADLVRRDQMASFLGRALDLTPFVAEPFGGEIVVAVDQEPPTLNPYVPGGDNPIVKTIGAAYLGGVYDIDGESLELVPDLVTELPTVANGGVVINSDGTMTVAYDIDPEAVWSDGPSVSGADFVFTLNTLLDPQLPVDKSGYDEIVTVTAEADRFEMTFAAPTLTYETLFPVIFPKHAVEGTDFDSDWNDKMWPSAGPFVLDSWVKGDRLRVVRNERYWRTDVSSGRSLPYADSVVFEFHPGLGDAVSAFEARAADVIEPQPSLAVVNQLETLAPLGVEVDAAEGPIWEHINFQFDKAREVRNAGSVNQNLEYRKGVAHAVDRDAIAADIWGGWVGGLDSFVDASTPDFSLGAWAQYDYAIAKARSYVDTAENHFGVERLLMVFTTTSNNDARVRLAEMLVGMIDAAGIDYENQLEDSQLFFGTTLDTGTWDVGSWAWVGATGYAGHRDVLEIFDPDSPPPPDGNNYIRWGSPGSTLSDASSARYAAIIDELAGEVDPQALLALMQEAESILADNVIIIPLYARPVFLAWWEDEVGGMGATAQTYTWNIGEWYRLDV